MYRAILKYDSIYMYQYLCPVKLIYVMINDVIRVCTIIQNMNIVFF